LAEACQKTGFEIHGYCCGVPRSFVGGEI
jgi:hypothetical protein